MRAAHHYEFLLQWDIDRPFGALTASSDHGSAASAARRLSLGLSPSLSYVCLSVCGLENGEKGGGVRTARRHYNRRVRVQLHWTSVRKGSTLVATHTHKLYSTRLYRGESLSLGERASCWGWRRKGGWIDTRFFGAYLNRATERIGGGERRGKEFFSDCTLGIFVLLSPESIPNLLWFPALKATTTTAWGDHGRWCLISMIVEMRCFHLEGLQSVVAKTTYVNVRHISRLSTWLPRNYPHARIAAACFPCTRRFFGPFL